jgi:primosomal protein N'
MLTWLWYTNTGDHATETLLTHSVPFLRLKWEVIVLPPERKLLNF